MSRVGGSAGIALAVLVGAVALASGCRSSRIEPGIGDISFRLTWSGAADLDLYVTSPLGERIDFLRRTSPSGGLLDIDCNLDPELAALLATEGDDRPSATCSQPMENVYWPRGEAPEGTFEYWAVIANGSGLEEGDRYRLEVRLGRKVVETHEGWISELEGSNEVFEIDYPPPPEELK